MHKSSTYSLFLLTSIFLTFIWVNTDYLLNFSLQLTAFFVIVLIIVKHFHNNVSLKMSETIISTVCVLLIIHATGGLGSPFFFLNFFLLFEMSFVLAPSASAVLTLGLVTFYFYTYPIRSFQDIIGIFAFILMAPLSFICGKLYEKVKGQKKEIDGLNHKLQQLQDQLASNPISPVN